MDNFNFCPACGQPVQWVQTHGALRPRCPACGQVHFFDPKVAVAVMIEQGDSLLMIRRGIEPGKGRWALPAGYVDRGEDPAHAAEREALEETHLTVRVTQLFDLIPKTDPTEGADILLVYRAELVAGTAQAGDDAAEVRFMTRADIPPEPEIAFASTKKLLTWWTSRHQ